MSAGVDTQNSLPPLLQNTQSIRLLRYLTPDRPKVPLRFELYAFDLATCPQYATLSYTWVDPFLDTYTRFARVKRNWHSTKTVIFCNDAPVSILPNLHEALQELVVCHGSLWLFIDALCIDQKDESEKAVQVKLLSQVFANAQHCICWLGPSDDTTDTCVTAVQTFYQILSQAAKHPKWANTWMQLPIQHRRVMEHFPCGTQGLELLKKYVLAIALLGHRRWFTRAWVIQEFALSKDVFLFCGQHTIDSRCLRIVSLWLHHLAEFTNQFDSIGMDIEEGKKLKASIARVFEMIWAQDLINKPWFLERIKLRYEVADPMQVQAAALFDFLYRCRRCAALDERDRIYALSGMVRMMVREKVQLVLEPDYSLPLGKVFTDVTARFVQYLPTLDFLALADRCPSDSTVMLRLPSWVPDWSLLPRCDTLASRAQFSAGLVPLDDGVGLRTVRGNALMLDGIHVDVVGKVGSSFMELVDLARGYLKCQSGNESAARVYNFWRTLVWGDEGETGEGQPFRKGIPSSQYDVAIHMLWLSRHAYRNGYRDNATVNQMAEIVNLVSGNTLHVSNIVKGIRRDKKQQENE